MSYQAFDESWFSAKQGAILYCLNSRLLGSWSRWILCIDKQDVGYENKISEIGPNFYTVLNDDDSFTSDFRIHPKYAKRLYYAFRPVWWAMHWWDEIFADSYAPSLSFGFATLTANPDASSGSTTCDGYVENLLGGGGIGLPWANSRGDASGTGTSLSAASFQAPYIEAAPTGANTFTNFNRSFCSFSISAAVNPAVSITDAVVSLARFSAPQNTLTNSCNLYVYESTQANANTLAVTDYQAFNTTQLSSNFIIFGDCNAAADGQYLSLTLNSSGLTYIRSVASVAKLAFLDSFHDIGNSQPTWVAANYVSFFWRSADTTGTSTDPKLVITYVLMNRLKSEVDGVMRQSNAMPTGRSIRPRMFRPGWAE